MNQKGKKFVIVGVVLVIICVGLFFFINKKDKTNDPRVYSFLGDKINYSLDRGAIEVNRTFFMENDSILIYKVNYKTRKFMDYETTIYGLMFIPKGKTDVPGILLVPGGGMKKEQKANQALDLAKQGFAVYTFDQRGIGETGGAYLGVEEDYSAFTRGFEPIQHLSVYDILRSYDAMKTFDEINKDNIIIVGESMGGRYAIIATALDPGIKGMIAISASGFNVQRDYQPYNGYLRSIDPDNYVSSISPRPIYFFQSVNDSVVKYADTKVTYGKAGDPKKIFVYNQSECSHGYCPPMHEDLLQSIKTLTG